MMRVLYSRETVMGRVNDEHIPCALIPFDELFAQFFHPAYEIIDGRRWIRSVDANTHRAFFMAWSYCARARDGKPYFAFDLNGGGFPERYAQYTLIYKCEMDHRTCRVFGCNCAPRAVQFDELPEYVWDVNAARMILTATRFSAPNLH